MITTITIIISALIALNFLLLKFSSNNTAQRKSSKRPIVMQSGPKVFTKPPIATQLAPTGS